MYIVTNKDLGPKLRLTAFNEVTGLLLKHGVVVGDNNKLVIAESLGVGNVC